MIREDKFNSALMALNAVLVGARTMAHEGCEHRDIAKALDHAEYLPLLILDAKDQTDAFRSNLVELAQHYEQCGAALERFDRSAPSEG